MVNGAKIKRDTSRSLLQGGEEQSSSKKRGKADKSVVIDPNVPLQVQQERHLATAEGNSTVDKERDEVPHFFSCSNVLSVMIPLKQL